MEFRHVLAFTDGRPECERAVEAAASLAARVGGRVTVLHVAEPLVLDSGPGLETEVNQAFTSGRDEELERLRQAAEKYDVEVKCEARVGRPFLEIIRAVYRLGADLVVKAARGRGRLGWPMFGSTALHLMRKCPVPVWLVAEEAQPVPRRIMALLSSDPASDARQSLDRDVLRVASELATTTGAELAVGAAWDAPGETLLRRRLDDERIRAYVEGARRRAEEGLGRALAPFGSAINPARVHLVRGVPYVELVGLAEDRADLVVIGTAPPSGGAALLIREEAEEVIHRLETSILAVKPEGFVSPVDAG